MKRVYVNEDWCLGCHLCEYYCGCAHSAQQDMVKAYKAEIQPTSRIQVEDSDNIHFAVNCRHCDNPLCVKSCITGALSVSEEGIIVIDESRCVGCYTCVLTCPYGCIVTDGEKVAKKCDLCMQNGGEPACVAGCPNRAIVCEER